MVLPAILELAHKLKLASVMLVRKIAEFEKPCLVRVERRTAFTYLGIIEALADALCLVLVYFTKYQIPDTYPTFSLNSILASPIFILLA